jgi:uncharacterized repeat protein (TIGR01451 family)
MSRRHRLAANGAWTVATEPGLTVTSSHIDPFFVGQSNASYALTVTNTGGQPTSSAVTLTDTLPSALTLSSIWGPGWNCSGANCTNGSPVAAGASFPPVFVAVVPPRGGDGGDQSGERLRRRFGCGQRLGRNQHCRGHLELPDDHDKSPHGGRQRRHGVAGEPMLY